MSTTKKTAKKTAKKAAPKKAAPKKAAVKKTAAKKTGTKKAVAKKTTPIKRVNIPLPKANPKPVPEKLVSLPESVETSLRVVFKLRGEKVQVLDLRGKSDIADFFIVCTCSSEAQMQAILTGLQREFKTARLQNMGVEYRAGVRWAVFDGIETMVHLFEDKAREEYSLERLWQDGQEIFVKAEDYLKTDTGDSSDEELV